MAERASSSFTMARATTCSMRACKASPSMARLRGLLAIGDTAFRLPRRLLGPQPGLDVLDAPARHRAVEQPDRAGESGVALHELAERLVVHREPCHELAAAEERLPRRGAVRTHGVTPDAASGSWCTDVPYTRRIILPPTHRDFQWQVMEFCGGNPPGYHGGTMACP